VPQLSFNASTVDVTQRGLPTNYVQGLFTAPPITSPDIYPMEVAAAMLRDRVFEEVRVKRNLSYAPNAFLNSQGANVGGIYVTAVDANHAVGIMLNEIALIQKGLAHSFDQKTQQPVLVPIDKSNIDAVAAQFLTTYYLGQETNAAQAANLAEYELIGGGWRNSFETIAKLRAVTPADVQRVAQKYMRNIRFVVLGNPAQIDKNVFTGQAGI
jgi:predicted Zn-dependent peptidase